GGAVVVNRATVYFPSVPEATPTNAVVNMVQPAVATPQNLTTAYKTPLAITLSGREVSGLPLTYALVDPPRSGALTGAPPNLTYTPAENFTGPDAFTFQVSNGASTSRPAQVTIEVTPQGDTTPPQVLWTNPADGAGGMAVSAAPVFTDTQGPVYAPVILIGVSEPLDTATVHAGTVTLTRGGAAVAASVAFDGGVNQIVLYPRTALGAGEYRVTVTTGVKDAAGNALAAAHTATFTIGEAAGEVYLPLITR
ncbi:MAG: Ig-like domain-containing protein, partial [Caldilinea sp.]|nr:Ig-like domain-containing protein [Caldilinea sp.]